MLIVLLPVSLASFTQAVRNDVVIDEIMCDPTPLALPGGGLPETEFIELKNVSLRSVNLNGWKISDATSTATISTGFVLMPDSFVIICSNSAAAMLSVFGRTLGISSFPSLDNDGEWIALKSKEGLLIHAVDYKKSWYRNAVRSEGGYTLEMTDTKNACSGYSNWKATISATGGTPGKKNSIDAANPDEQPPALLKAFATDSLNIVLVFDEPLDSLQAIKPANYLVSNHPDAPRYVEAVAPLFSALKLRLNYPLQNNKIYTVTVKDGSDCSGNRISAYTAKVGLSVAPAVHDLVINEILFNPAADGVDYVEIYNRSTEIIDIKNLYLANKAGNGAPGSLRRLGTESRLLFPGDYLLATENLSAIQQQFTLKNNAAYVEIGTMPSYPDDKGNVILLNSGGLIIDTVSYDEKWHFKLINNKQGVSLERIDYNKPSNNSSNWHSAATSAGYGTPGYRNSQFMQDKEAEGLISIYPEIFSPDNDGFNDFTTISYQFAEPGYVCNITVFDANGKIVRHLTRNALCGLKGYFRWDGLDEKNNRLHTGIYIILTEVFTLKGKTRKFKSPTVLARRQA